MALIYGFDQSKNTGWAVYDTERSRSNIKCGVFRVLDKSDAYFTADQIGVMTGEIIQEYGKPDFVVLEGQLETVVRNTMFKGIIYPWIATAAIISTISKYAIPYGTIPSATWRKAFYGTGFTPPKDNKGKNDWKTPAVDECERIGITLPKQKTIAHNAAEACALAICWKSKGMRMHAGRYEKPWMDLIAKG
jgi:hypothetical protein